MLIAKQHLSYILEIMWVTGGIGMILWRDAYVAPPGKDQMKDKKI